MRSAMRTLFLFLLLAAFVHAEPVIYIIGDSTVKNGTKGLKGWGEFLAEHCDAAKCRVENRALGGRSSRSFLREGLWEKVRAQLKPGDVVIMQFGHNDGGPLDREKARASLKGSGAETREVTVVETGAKETVLTYGGYLRRCISEAKAAGATAVVCSPIPRNIWKDGKVTRATADYAKWAQEAAMAGGALFIPLNDLIATRYDGMGEAKVKGFFPGDHTHTNEEGARLNARQVADALRSLPGLAALMKPQKLVALTFDDACLSHRTVVAPRLRELGFGATFFVCEYPGMFGNAGQAMTWTQIRELSDMGFEIGNHTLTHKHAPKENAAGYEAELRGLDDRCAAAGIPKPVSFAWPAYESSEAALAVVKGHGITAGRVGGGRRFDPPADDPLLIPSVSTSGSDEKAEARVLLAIASCDERHPLVLTFHGVPDPAHPQVNTPPEKFERYLKVLEESGASVISLRELVARVSNR
jgi:rhamnogalacturonan acetylesterase